MADNVAITAGAGTNVSSDERTIDAITVQVQRVNDIGASITLQTTALVQGITAAATSGSVYVHYIEEYDG